MKGKRIPQIGLVEVAIVEESGPRLLAFDRNELDHLDVRYDLALKVVDESGNLRPAYAKRGVALGRGYELTVTYAYFNMDDATFGGYTPDKVALRRAICTAYSIGEEIRVIRQGQGRAATQPIPPDVAGHVADLKDPPKYDPAVARALLDRFGYKVGSAGLRTLPDGRPLVLEMASEPDGTARLFDELWQRSLQAVAVKIEFRKQKWPELYKLAHEGKLAFWELGLSGGVADYYMQQFYGPSAGSANLSRFRNAQFDELFVKSRRVADSAERSRLYARMTEIVAAYNPWCPKAYRISNTVSQPWVAGYRKNPYYQITPWQYLDLDAGQQQSAK
jgi:ABC-type transport system substrate-binding protein